MGKQTKVFWLCDICGKEFEQELPMCEYCKKDYCPECTELISSYVEHSHGNGETDVVLDKTFVFCKACLDKKPEFLKQISKAIVGEPYGEKEFILGPDN